MIYLDLWENEYVAEPEVNAPPERYLLYIKGTEGNYIEKYNVNGNPAEACDYAYTDFERTNFPEQVAKNRQRHFEKNGFQTAILYAYSVPPSVYERIEQKIKERGAEE